MLFEQCLASPLYGSIPRDSIRLKLHIKQANIFALSQCEAGKAKFCELVNTNLKFLLTLFSIAMWHFSFFVPQ